MTRNRPMRGRSPGLATGPDDASRKDGTSITDKQGRKVMSDRPISDSALSIVREMCDTVHPDIQLPTFIVKGMIARIDRWEAQPKTFDDAMAAAERHMAEASEALNLAMTYAHDERPDVLRILSAVSSGIEEVSWTVIEARAFK